MVHKLPVSKLGEHTYAAYNEENYPRGADLEFWDPVKKQISDFWKVPDFWEIYTLPNDLDHFQLKNRHKKLY